VIHPLKIAGKIPIRTQFGIERGENAMAVATRSKKVVLDKKIEEFCEQSAKLLTSIHERCSNKENGKKTKKGKRGRKKKADSV
jgi:hypothetical protein